MTKKTHTQSTKSCSDCIHEYACRMWTDGRMISDESASRCPNHTTVKESAAYLIGKMDGKKHAIHTADVAPRAEWISARERLPDENGVFIVSLKESGYENLVYFDVRPYADGEWRNLPDKFTVSHWMPLPDPPKGD